MDENSKLAVERAKSKIMVVPEGTVILREGEINLDMYKIIKGHVEVYINYGKPQETLSCILGPQSLFGEFGLLLHEPAIYTIIAYSEVHLIRVTEGEMGDFVQSNHNYIVEIMRSMAKNMMSMQKQVNLMAQELNSELELNEEIKKTVKMSRNVGIYRADADNENGGFQYF
jgi:CRP-like cAMP-binding protein